MKTKNATMVLVLAGLGVLAGTAAHAASNSTLVYNNGDLLVSFRDTVDGGGSDATIDLGGVSTFLTTVQGLSGQTAVLDSGFSTTAGYTPTFSGATLITDISQPGTGSGDGTADDIGMTAASANPSAAGNAKYTVYLTSQILANQLATGGTAIGQQGTVAQISTAGVIQSIGQGAQAVSLGGAGHAFGTAPNAGLVAEGTGFSYHDLVTDTPGNVDYQGYESPSIPFEATPATGAVYEALWEVPLQGNGSDVYEGYFTFDPNGEVDFTEVSPVPEPPVYVLLGATGLVGWALRRRIRALVA